MRTRDWAALIIVSAWALFGTPYIMMALTGERVTVPDILTILYEESGMERYGPVNLIGVGAVFGLVVSILHFLFHATGLITDKHAYIISIFWGLTLVPMGFYGKVGILVFGLTGLLSMGIFLLTAMAVFTMWSLNQIEQRRGAVHHAELLDRVRQAIGNLANRIRDVVNAAGGTPLGNMTNDQAERLAKWVYENTWDERGLASESDAIGVGGPPTNLHERGTWSGFYADHAIQALDRQLQTLRGRLLVTRVGWGKMSGLLFAAFLFMLFTILFAKYGPQILEGLPELRLPTGLPGYGPGR